LIQLRVIELHPLALLLGVHVASFFSNCETIRGSMREHHAHGRTGEESAVEPAFA